MQRRMAATIGALALVVGLGLGACSSSSGDAGPQTTATTASTSSSTSTTGSNTKPPATTKPAPQQVFAPDPKTAAANLVGAWQAGDRTAATTFADAQSVTNIFTQPPAGYELYGCDSGEFSTSNCNYRNRATNGYAQITAEKSAKGWIVTAVAMSTDG